MIAALAACGNGGSKGGAATATPTAASPTFSPGAGSYATTQTVSLVTTTTGASIYYTTNGTAPTTSSTKYTGAITVGSSETIEAIAVASGYTNSAVASATYTITAVVTPVAATPVFSPAAGTYSAAQTVSISDATAGATIYYTTDGSTPTTSSTKYTAPISVSASETIKAIAAASGDTNSLVGSAAYSIITSTPIAFTTLYSFTANGSLLVGELGASLVQGTDGNFYGTTVRGGTNDAGSVFQMTPAGVVTTVYSFSGTYGPDGSTPLAGLVQGSDGNLYGTNSSGGADGSSSSGTVFSITPGGTLTTLYSFSLLSPGGTGQPDSPLVQGSDGDFYGITTAGGSSSSSIFKITSSGALTILYTFGTATGQLNLPAGGLIQASDGNFYGTTEVGGANGDGAVFKVTPSGAFTTLYSFNGTDGEYPMSGLVQGSDGNFYGTTRLGGAGFVAGSSQNTGNGTVFEITPSGVLTTLYSFSGGAGGGSPLAPLVSGSDGNLYGTFDAGIFRITPTGAYTLLYTFTNPAADGCQPTAALVQGTDGNFYGTTSLCGAHGFGTIFRLSAGLSPGSAAVASGSRVP
jgi:uncharacterized repeat protein (TIGR03803 family)